MKSAPLVVVWYFRLIALITAVMGLSLLLWPSVASIFFDETTKATLFFVRIIGSTLLGYACLNALASTYRQEARLLKEAAWGNLTTLVVALILCLINLHTFDKNAWLIITQHAVFAAGFVGCIYQLRKITSPS